MTIFRRHAGVLALLILLGGAQVASSQTNVGWLPASGNWTTPNNWEDTTGSGNFVPDTQFDETANISNGGVATVNSSVSPSPGHIVLGLGLAETGTLIIENNGDLTSTFSTGNTGTAGIVVGGEGTGHLTVEPGGSIAGRTLIVGGTNAGSTLTLGAATGAAANMNLEISTTISREARIIGPNVNFVSPAFSLFSTSVFIPEITNAAHSTIDVSGGVFIDNGTLRPEFSNGFTPTPGSKWNLFDAGSINGQFTIDTSAAPALPVGQEYRFSVVPNASNGVFGQLALEQLLVLNVNRATGDMSISNGPTPINIDGYSIQSGLGGLNPSGWNSLQDQSNSDWRESPQGGSANALSELKPTGSTSITNAAPLSLGAAFQLPTATEFGTELEDITFEYFSTDGTVTQGVINYIGDKQYNNLVLEVDPSSGEARLENGSNLTVAIDGYKIESESGSLLFADGQWNSLDDQDTAGGDWDEANPSASLLAELKATSSTVLAGGTGYNLGTLFKTLTAGGDEDLTFQYLFTGEDEFRDGEVAYRAVTAGPNADFDDDSAVDGTDLGIWESAYGSTAGGDADGDGDSDGADFLTWQRQYTGAAGVSAVSAVPEPSSLVLLGCLACPMSFLSRRVRRTKKVN